MLEGLPQATVATDEEVMTLINRQGLYGLGIGYVDVALLTATRLTADAVLWTVTGARSGPRRGGLRDRSRSRLTFPTDGCRQPLYGRRSTKHGRRDQQFALNLPSSTAEFFDQGRTALLLSSGA